MEEMMGWEQENDDVWDVTGERRVMGRVRKAMEGQGSLRNKEYEGRGRKEERVNVMGRVERKVN